MADRYLDSMLGKGEEVVFATRQHWFVLLRNIFVEGVAILTILALYLVLNGSAFLDQPTKNLLPFILLLIILPFISLLIDFFQWYNRKFIVTNWRVIQLSGVINKDVIDSSLEKVNDVKLRQSVIGRIFNFGTVEILTASELAVNKFKTIGGPIFFKTTIINAKEQLEREGSQRYYAPEPKMAAVPAQPPSAAANISGTLSQMEELRKQGVLTDDEFKRIKDSMISKL
jgi:uncharacterized membrane protein YdbT with pleckstrin-like domain